MNSLKSLLTVAVLAGIGYGVYIRINRDADAPPPAGVAAGWDTTPKVQMPEVAMSGGGPGGSPLAPSFGPGRGSVSMPPRGGDAPPFGATSPPGGSAPPFAPPGAGAPSGNSAPPGGNAPPFASPPASMPPGGEAPAAPGIETGPPVSTLPGDRWNDPNQPPSDAPPAGSEPPGAAGASPYAPNVEPPGGAASPYDAPPAGAEPSAYDRYRDASAPPAADAAMAPPADQAAPDGSAPAGAAAPGSYGAAMEAARRELEAGQMAAALRQLSSWYESPQLSPGEHQQLNELLDQIAGTVVYSTQHLLEPPYEVQSGERLEDIGQRYNVPWQLLAKINGIDDPQSLRAGERLKVVRGPFAATISLDKRELTLLTADGSYAGRFKIGVGLDQPPREGVFAVSDKAMDPIYRGRERAIGPRDPNNPLGDRWIGLGSDAGIHGTNRPETIGRNDLPGSISLSPRDVEDVFDILSVGSKVTIRR